MGEALGIAAVVVVTEGSEGLPMNTITSPLDLFLGFAAGCAFTFGLATLLWKRVTVAPVVNATLPAVTLPESLRVVVTQPPPPLPVQTAAMDLWKEVYQQTLDAKGYPSCMSDVTDARDAATSAVLSTYGEVPNGVGEEAVSR